ncbi:MAG: cation:dicarboxylase symporter family transporter, partial [Chlamydiales bacterium]
IEGIAIVAGIDRLRDIVGTIINVIGDAVVSVYVAKTEEEFDETRYNSGVYISYEHSSVTQETQS